MNIAGGEVAVSPGVGKIGDVVYGIVEIKIIVVHAIHEVLEIVNAGEGEAALDDVRVFEERVRGVVGAEGSAYCGDGESRRLAIVPNERNDFLAQVRIENG